MRRAGIIIISLAVLIVASEARDPGQFTKTTPEMKAWFDSLKCGLGPCCSDADGAAVSDVDWESKDGHYRVRLGGEWIGPVAKARCRRRQKTASRVCRMFPSKIQLSACGNAKEGMEKKEGQPITVLSEAVVVPSGVVRLMELQEKGWSYVRPQLRRRLVGSSLPQ